MRLRRDIARALDLKPRHAGRVLASAFRDNDRAVLEILAQADPRCDIEALLADIDIAPADRLRALGDNDQGAILLGMHMGNGVAMAGKLAGLTGRRVHVVFRDPRRLQPGLLARGIERVGATPLALDRANPTRSMRRMLRVLQRGELLYVLMDQANKREGEPRLFLGKRMNMPSGVPALARRIGCPVIPIHAERADHGWGFRVYPELRADSDGALLDAICTSMEHQVRTHPELWAWHHRRWKRYHFESEPEVPENTRPCR
ncbi:MAG: lysophospholipid acyltransferase family protein [Wenzhouxiangellaceae bacterium]